MFSRTSFLTIGFAVISMTLIGAHPVAAASFFELDTGTTKFQSVDVYGNTVIVVGNSGKLVSSDDFMQTWTINDGGSSTTYYGVDVADEDTAYAVGASGAMRRTTNSGTSWTTLTSGTSSSLYDVACTSTTACVAVGASGTIRYTENGTAWSAATVSPSTTASFMDVSLSGSTGYAVGTSGKIYKSTNSGLSWNEQTSGVTNTLRGVDIISSTVYAVGDDDTFLVYADGSWSTQYGSGLPSRGDYLSIDFLTSSSGIVSFDDLVYKTSDGGDSWEQVEGTEGTGFVNDVKYHTYYKFAATSTELFLEADYVPAAPTNFTVENGYTNDSTPVLTWTDSTISGSIPDVAYYVLGVVADVGPYVNVGTGESYDWPTALEDGEYTMGLQTLDESGNTSDSATATFVVDTVAPELTTYPITNAVGGEPYTFRVLPLDDASGIASCSLIVDALPGPAMELAAIFYYVVDVTLASGDHSYIATCFDAAGNYVSSASVSGTWAPEGTVLPDIDDEEEDDTSTDDQVVDDGETDDTTTDDTVDTTTDDGDTSVVADELTNVDGEAETGTLIKLACEAGADVNDPCKAVYYYSAEDDKRHAFPNEKVYFTWYNDFDDVIVVSADFMASLSLGTNVTYRPGTWMVKFLSVNTVYVVTRGSVLRAIDSETTAGALYGTDWNQHIHDIDDAFFGNYDFGDDLNDAEDYDVDAEESAITTIDANLLWQD